ncbi:MAG: pentapeptide repeat-containing protein [Deltaproteobacteria bacterium]|nr:pentapeptide repeat-containing protein [Deltaproteobacteria bacterium]
MKTTPPYTKVNPADSPPQTTIATASATSGYAVREMEGYRSEEAITMAGRDPSILKLFISYSHHGGDKKLKEDLETRLQKRFKSAKTSYRIQLISDRNVEVGQKLGKEPDTKIPELIQKCDGAILLLSTDFVNSDYIMRDVEMPLFRELGFPLFPLAFKVLDLERQELAGIEKHLIFFYEKQVKKQSLQEVWDKGKESERVHLVNEFAKAIEARIEDFRLGNEEAVGKLKTQNAIFLASLARAIAQSRGKDFYDRELFVETSGWERSFGALKGNRIDNVLEHLYKWAIDPQKPIMCALFGDYGMGKTFTCRMLTRKMLAEHQQTPQAHLPLPIYLGLRFCPSDKADSLDSILAEILRRSSPISETERLTPQRVIELAQNGAALIIFDGFDELAVHYSKEKMGHFLRELWRILPDEGEAPSRGKPREQRAKLLISCRTHFFENFGADQEAIFLGKKREGKKDYLFCELDYLDAEQIRQYLRLRLKCDTAALQRIEALLQEVYDLPGMAKRPYLLSLISEHIPQLEADAAAGRAINTARLYEIFISEWLNRDEGKHNFMPRHKLRIMRELALHFHIEGIKSIKSMNADAVSNWLAKWLYRNQEIGFAYKNSDGNTVLEKDLRTATFIIRATDEDFGFAHTSLQEYFLASRIVEALANMEADTANILAIPLPSTETLDFAAQLWALQEKECAIAGQQLTAILEKGYTPRASELCLALWLALAKHDLPCPHPQDVHLEGAKLTGWELANIDLVNCQLQGAELQGMKLRNVRALKGDFSGALLAYAEAFDCDFSGASFAEIQGGASVWKRCNLDASLWRGATLTYAQFINCNLAEAREMPDNRLTSFIQSPPFPTPFAAGFQINTYTGHSESVTSCAFAPDGKSIVSGANDNTLRLWDVATGKEIRKFTGHPNSVTSCAFAPDGQSIVSGARDNTLRLWDVPTGTCLKIFAYLPQGQFASWLPTEQRLLASSSEAWRWLGLTPAEGFARYPIEALDVWQQPEQNEYHRKQRTKTP